MHVLLSSFLEIQIVVYRSSHQSTPSASLRQNVHTSLTRSCGPEFFGIEAVALQFQCSLFFGYLVQM